MHLYEITGIFKLFYGYWHWIAAI